MTKVFNSRLLSSFFSVGEIKLAWALFGLRAFVLACKILHIWYGNYPGTMTLNPSVPFMLESGFGSSNLSFHVSELVFLSVEFFFFFIH